MALGEHGATRRRKSNVRAREGLVLSTSKIGQMHENKDDPSCSHFQGIDLPRSGRAQVSFDPDDETALPSHDETVPAP